MILFSITECVAAHVLRDRLPLDIADAILEAAQWDTEYRQAGAADTHAFPPLPDVDLAIYDGSVFPVTWASEDEDSARKIDTDDLFFALRTQRTVGISKSTTILADMYMLEAEYQSDPEGYSWVLYEKIPPKHEIEVIQPEPEPVEELTVNPEDLQEIAKESAELTSKLAENANIDATVAENAAIEESPEELPEPGWQDEVFGEIESRIVDLFHSQNIIGKDAVDIIKQAHPKIHCMPAR